MTNRYTNPPRVNTGDEWTADSFNRFILDNIRYLNTRTSAGSAATLASNQVAIGSGTGIAGLTLSRGALVVGGATAAQALPVGSEGQVLQAKSGATQWGDLTVTIDRATLYRFLH